MRQLDSIMRALKRHHGWDNFSANRRLFRLASDEPSQSESQRGNGRPKSFSVGIGGIETAWRESMTPTPSTQRPTNPGMAFRGARDFYLAAQILGQRRNTPEVKASRAPWSLQAFVTCTAFCARARAQGSPHARRKGGSEGARWSQVHGGLRSTLAAGALRDRWPTRHQRCAGDVAVRLPDDLLDRSPNTHAGWNNSTS